MASHFDLREGIDIGSLSMVKVSLELLLIKSIVIMNVLLVKRHIACPNRTDLCKKLWSLAALFMNYIDLYHLKKKKKKMEKS